MNTIQALKLIRILEAGLQKSQSSYNDKVGTFLEHLHEAGYQIEPIPLQPTQVAVAGDPQFNSFGIAAPSQLLGGQHPISQLGKAQNSNVGDM